MKKMLPVIAAALVVAAPVALSTLAVAEEHAAAPAAAEAVAPVEFTLVDGTKGVIEGDKVFVMKDGQKVAAPDGEHTLADGSKVNVKDGALVKDAAPAEGAAH